MTGWQVVLPRGAVGQTLHTGAPHRQVFSSGYTDGWGGGGSFTSCETRKRNRMYNYSVLKVRRQVELVIGSCPSGAAWGGGFLGFQGVQPCHISPEVNDYDRCDGQLVATVL